MSPRVLWIALALGGCGLGIAGTALPDGGGPDAATSPDASTDAPFPDGGIGDASTFDVGPVDDAGCFTLVSDDFSSPDPRWGREGDAVFDGGVAVLVVAGLQHHGAIFIPVPAAGAPPTTFEASFKMAVRAVDGGPPADGVTLAWASDATQPPIGGTGSQLGFCPDGNSANIGPRGGALSLHVSSIVGVSALESDGGACIVPSAGAVKPFTFTDKQLVAARISGADIDASVGATSFTFTLTNAVPLRWIGFTAATGGAVAEFAVDDVTLRVCP